MDWPVGLPLAFSRLACAREHGRQAPEKTAVRHGAVSELCPGRLGLSGPHWSLQVFASARPREPALPSLLLHSHSLPSPPLPSLAISSSALPSPLPCPPPTPLLPLFPPSSALCPISPCSPPCRSPKEHFVALRVLGRSCGRCWSVKTGDSEEGTELTSRKEPCLFCAHRGKRSAHLE